MGISSSSNDIVESLVKTIASDVEEKVVFGSSEISVGLKGGISAFRNNTELF